MPRSSESWLARRNIRMFDPVLTTTDAPVSYRTRFQIHCDVSGRLGYLVDIARASTGLSRTGYVRRALADAIQRDLGVPPERSLEFERVQDDFRGPKPTVSALNEVDLGILRS